jgi:arylsulfatase A-like enzyme
MLIGLFVAFFVLTFDAVAASPTTPNVIVILVDDLGHGDLSSYGATDLETPNIDKLVASGMRFDNFYANCPVCSPTRASLLTGRYPELVGVPGVIRTHAKDNWGYLDPSAVTLPETLGKVGYDTAIVGKWHLGLEAPNRPTDRGFAFFKGYLGDMMEDYYNHRRHGINYMRSGTEEIDPEGHATDLFSEWAIDYLLSEKRSERPFFLYLAYNAPHTPIQPPTEWVDKVLERQPGIDRKRASLVALIEHMDHGIGRVLETLRSTPLADNTIVIFTSDNGGQLNVGANNGPLRDGKQSMYEGGLKVPACFSWPGHIAPGTRCDTSALTMDLFPTICEIAGAEVDHPIDGISILPTLNRESQTNLTRALYFHRREGGDRYGGLTINAVRDGDWKLLQDSPFAPLELYNLKTDPQETTDLAETNRDQFRRLSELLRVQVQRGGAVPWQRPARRDDKPGA